MKTIISLDELGPRICIIGPSNSGKSTLAQAISRKTELPAVHLDQLHHLPNTNWVPRDNDEFLQLHASAISEARWIIEGNYSKCIAERHERATGLILLDIPTALGLLRYLRRCYSAKARAGGLEGCQDRVNWEMIKYITLVSPVNRKRHRALYDESKLHKLLLLTPKEVKGCYKRWDL